MATLRHVLIRGLLLVTLGSAALATPAAAATISLQPRTDCNRTYWYTDSCYVDHYTVKCHYAGTVTFSDPNNTLERIDCYVGPIGSEWHAGTQGDNWTHPNGASSYGYSRCCIDQAQEEWSGFYNVIDKAYMLDGEDLVLVAEDNATWAPGASL